VEDHNQENICYECGQPGGTILKLCPACISKNDKARDTLKTTLEVDQVGVKDPFFYKLTSLGVSSTLVVFVAFVAIVVLALITGKTFKLSFGVVFVLLTAALAALAAVVAYLILLVETFSYSILLGVGSIVFPPLVILYVYLSYQNKESPERWIVAKTALIAQVAGLVLLGSAWIAAKIVRINILEPSTYRRGSRTTLVNSHPGRDF
jgi:hypothetical protein